MAAALTPADRALAAGFAGQLEAPRYFDISGLDAGGLKRELCIQADDGFAAVNAGLDLGWSGVVAHPHPQELTYEDGYKRFPKALHPKAFTEAWRGWQDAQADAAERNFDSTLTEAAKWAHNDRMALNLQIDRPGELERAHRALGV